MKWIPLPALSSLCHCSSWWHFESTENCRGQTRNPRESVYDRWSSPLPLLLIARAVTTTVVLSTPWFPVLSVLQPSALHINRQYSRRFPAVALASLSQIYLPDRCHPWDFLCAGAAQCEGMLSLANSALQSTNGTSHNQELGVYTAPTCALSVHVNCCCCIISLDDKVTCLHPLTVLSCLSWRPGDAYYSYQMYVAGCDTAGLWVAA